MRIIVIHGPPLSGKSKHGHATAVAHGLQYLSSGDIARSLMDPETEKEFARGRLSPHHTKINQAIISKLNYAYAYGLNIILDGFPRTMDQLEELNYFHEVIRDGYATDTSVRRILPKMLMVNLNVSEDVLFKRAEKRARDVNDGPTVLKLRMETYLRETSLVFDNLHREQWIKLRIHIPLEVNAKSVQFNLDKAIKAYLSGHLDHIGEA